MFPYHLNDNGNQRTYSFLPNNDRDENGENVMTQSLIVHAPYRRIRHPELFPVILKDREERNHVDIMTQSLIVPPYRRVHHPELTPVQLKQKNDNRPNDVKKQQVYKAPKRAFSMTRLDQLARPKQRYLEEALKLRASVTKENLSGLCSMRPTSSMSLAGKQQQQPVKSFSKTTVINQNTSQHNLSTATNNSTILLRQRTSARKQRPVSYAGNSLLNSSNLNSTTLSSNLDSSVQSSSFNQQDRAPNQNRQNARNRLSFNNLINNRNLSASNSSRHNLMINSIDGSLVSNKPVLPKKPSHIKAAAAARKQAKQQDAVQESSKFKKSESSTKISQQKDANEFKMRKSVTNPEKIAEILDDNSLKVSKKIVVRKSTENLDEKSTDKNDKLSEKSSDKLEIKTTNDKLTRPKLKENNIKKENNSLFDELMNHQENTANQKQDENSQLIDLDDVKNEETAADSDELSMERNEEEDEESRRRMQEEEEEKRRLEIEQQNEIKRRLAQEEEKKRIAREEKEKELEEKAEKARQEREERLKKADQERIERKRLLDAIMSRTRKNAPGGNSKVSPSSENVNQNVTTTLSPDQQEQTDLNEKQQQNPDVVEDALKSNLNKLTNDNLSSSLNSNGKSDLPNYLDNDNKNRHLINGFKEMKIQSNSTFVFSQSNESYYTPGAN